MEGLGRNTVDDFRNGFPARALGTEVEYTHPSTVVFALETKLDNYSLVDFVDRAHLVSFGRNDRRSVIVSTGAEIYIDGGAIECATPECATPEELNHHERAGEQFVMNLISNIVRRAELSPVKVFKRSGYSEVDFEHLNKKMTNGTIGYHENYTSMNSFTSYDWTERPAKMKRDFNARCLSDFLALRKLVDGAGMIESDHFSLSQKLSTVNFMHYRPNRQFKGKMPFLQKSSRLEVRSGEHSKSDWATEFTIGLTSLVARLIEHNRYPKNLLLHDANDAVRALARDPHAEVTLQSGVMMKGMDVLYGIVEEADKLGQEFPDEYPQYEQDAAQKFIEFHSDLNKVNLRDNEVSALADRINWAARYDYIHRHGVNYEDFTIQDVDQLRYDLAWDWMLGEKDIARRMLGRHGLTTLTVDIPKPPETRAKTRVEITRELYRRGNLKSVEWHQIQPRLGITYELGGPLNMTPVRKLRIGDKRPELGE